MFHPRAVYFTTRLGNVEVDLLAHNKVMVIDAATVITGIFNFTKTTEYSAEKMLVIRDNPVIAGHRLRASVRCRHDVDPRAHRPPHRR